MRAHCATVTKRESVGDRRHYRWERPFHQPVLVCSGVSDSGWLGGSAGRARCFLGHTPGASSSDALASSKPPLAQCPLMGSTHTLLPGRAPCLHPPETAPVHHRQSLPSTVQVAVGCQRFLPLVLVARDDRRDTVTDQRVPVPTLAASHWRA